MTPECKAEATAFGALIRFGQVRYKLEEFGIWLDGFETKNEVIVLDTWIVKWKTRAQTSELPFEITESFQRDVEQLETEIGQRAPSIHL